MTAPPSQSSKRLLSEAIYEQLMTDEDAPPSVRLEAAKAYDAIENGRPGIARAVSVDEIGDLTDDQCERLFHALLRRIEAKQPAFHAKMISGIVDDMLAAQAARPAPKKSNFKRGPLAGKGPEVPRWPPTPRATPPLTPGANAIRSDLSAGLGEPGACPGETTGAAASPGFRGDGEQFNCATKPPNVVQLPGTARAGRPAYGITFGTIETLEQSLATAPNPHGGMHPSVVLRAAQKDPWRGR